MSVLPTNTVSFLLTCESLRTSKIGVAFLAEPKSNSWLPVQLFLKYPFLIALKRATRKPAILWPLYDCTVECDIADRIAKVSRTQPLPPRIRRKQQGIKITRKPTGETASASMYILPDDKSDAQSWVQAIRNASKIAIALAEQLNDRKPDIAIHPAEEKKLEEATLKTMQLKSALNTLQQELNKSQETVKQLASAYDSLAQAKEIEKQAATEILQQKEVDIQLLSKKALNLQSSNKELSDRVNKLYSERAKDKAAFSRLESESSVLRELYQRFQNDLSEGQGREKTEANVAQLCIQLARKRGIIQELQTENRRLKGEIASGFEHRQELMRDCTNKIETVEQLACADVVFELLRTKWLKAELQVLMARLQPLDFPEKENQTEKINISAERFNATEEILRRDDLILSAAARAYLYEQRAHVLSYELNGLNGPKQTERNVNRLRLKMIERYRKVLDKPQAADISFPWEAIFAESADEGLHLLLQRKLDATVLLSALNSVVSSSKADDNRFA